MNHSGKQRPKVSIVMLTYYAEEYVRQALESVISQKTTFEFEIIVSDDCSGDNTVSILKHYRELYPDLIRLQLNKENLGIPLNLYNARCLCRGEYITSISGDDYWIDDHKLERQVRYLEEHDDRFAVAGVLELRFDDDEVPYGCSPRSELIDTDISLEENLQGAMFSTGTVMMRNVFLTDEGRSYFRLMTEASRYIDDATDILLILNKGPVHILESHMVAHRVQRSKAGKHNFTSLYRGLESSRMSIELLNYVESNFERSIDLFYRYRETISTALIYALMTFKIGEFSNMYSTVPDRYRHRGLLPRAVTHSFLTGAKALSRRIKSIR